MLVDYTEDSKEKRRLQELASVQGKYIYNFFWIQMLSCMHLDYILCLMKTECAVTDHLTRILKPFILVNLHILQPSYISPTFYNTQLEYAI